MTTGLRRGGFIAAVVLSVMTAGVAGSLAASDGSDAIPAGYTGVESTLPTAFKTPVKKAGSCTIGFQNPIAANEFLSFLQKAVVAEGKRYGCRVITLDDALSPDKQVTNMQQLLAQKVGVIIFYPLDPKATTPVLKQAQRQGVPVVAIDASFGSTKKVPLITTQVWQSRDTQAYLQAKVMKQVKPNAKVGIIGIGIPAPAIKYLVQRRDLLGQEGRPERHRQPGQPVRRRHGRREGRERAAAAPFGHRRGDRLQRSLRPRGDHRRA